MYVAEIKYYVTLYFNCILHMQSPTWWAVSSEVKCLIPSLIPSPEHSFSLLNHTVSDGKLGRAWERGCLIPKFQLHTPARWALLKVEFLRVGGYWILTESVVIVHCDVCY